MSIVSKKSYNSCPLKKRPIYIIKEDEEIEDESAPVDLSNTNRSKPRIDKILRYSPETAIDFSKSKLTTINEETYDIKQSTDIKYSTTEPSEWYGKELRIDSHQSSQIYTHIKSENRSTRSEQYSPPTPREPSLSPPTVITEDYVNYREYYKNPYRNFNNNLVEVNRTSSYQETPNFYVPADNSILSPSSSHLSYGSNHSDIVDYVEPEDLSVNKNRKKVLVPTDSSANIQKYRTELSDKTSNDLYYQCRNCNKCYSTYAGLVKHQQTHVPANQGKQIAITRLNGNIISGKSEDSHNTKPINPPRYQCKDCGKSYSTYSGLTKHQQFHCPSAEGNQVKKSFSCKNCDKVYVSLGALKMHIRTHTLPCKCPLCGKAFSRPWLLQGHIRTHTGEKPFTCQHCHRAFADRSNLRAHLQTHSDIKKYSCTSCTKTFSRMSLLSKHLQGGCSGATSPPNYNQQYSHESIYEENHHHHHSDIYIHSSNDRSSYYEDLDQTQYHQKKTSYSENVHIY